MPAPPPDLGSESGSGQNSHGTGDSLVRSSCFVSPMLAPANRGPHYPLKFSAFTPRNLADSPNSSSILSNWLYFAIRSVLDADPVLIWPAPVATAKSAMKVSSVSPDRCEMMDV